MTLAADLRDHLPEFIVVVVIVVLLHTVGVIYQPGYERIYLWSVYRKGYTKSGMFMKTLPVKKKKKNNKIVHHERLDNVTFFYNVLQLEIV